MEERIKTMDPDETKSINSWGLNRLVASKQKL